MVADFADGLLGVDDEVQENLRQLAGIAEDGGQIGFGREVYGDVIAAQGMLVELQAALNQVAHLHGGLARLGRAGELEQEVLNNLRGTARLTMGQFELPAAGVVGSRVPEQFGHTEDGGERVIQLVGDSGDHLTHGREALGLD